MSRSGSASDQHTPVALEQGELIGKQLLFAPQRHQPALHGPYLGRPPEGEVKNRCPEQERALQPRRQLCRQGLHEEGPQEQRPHERGRHSQGECKCRDGLPVQKFAGQSKEQLALRDQLLRGSPHQPGPGRRQHWPRGSALAREPPAQSDLLVVAEAEAHGAEPLPHHPADPLLLAAVHAVEPDPAKLAAAVSVEPDHHESD